MNIEQMTQVSYYLLVLSILFAIAAIVIFFALDIPRCWNRIIGTHSTRSHAIKQHKKTCGKKEQNHLTEKKAFLRKDSKETILLSKHRAQQNRKKQTSLEETAMLNTKTEETLLLRSSIEKQEARETMRLVTNMEEQSIKGQKLTKERIKHQKTVPLCLNNNLCDSAESELTMQLDIGGMILIQDIVCMQEDSCELFSF